MPDVADRPGGRGAARGARPPPEQLTSLLAPSDPRCSSCLARPSLACASSALDPVPMPRHQVPTLVCVTELLQLRPAAARWRGTPPSGWPVWVGSRSQAAGPLPAGPPPGGLRGADRPGRGAGGRVHRPALGRRAGPGPGDRPGRLGAAPTSPASSGWSDPTSTGSTPARLSGHQPVDRAAGRAHWPRAGRAVTGAQMGLVLGWLSTRVLGQYDLLLTEEAIEDQDLVYFVGPNVVALEQLHGFEPARVPPVAGPPRGHPPLPVHRHPLDARLLRLAGRGGDRLARARSRPGSPRHSGG